MIPQDYLARKKPHKYNAELHQGRYRPHIYNDDHCYYLVEIVSEGYSASEANNLIHNFKKPIDRKRNKNEWQYKLKAIEALSEMLCMLKLTKPYTIIPAPTSKPRHHQLWDDRIDKVVEKLKNCNENIYVEYALDTINATPAYHENKDKKRIPDEIKKNTKWNSINKLEYPVVILIDDVLTTGAHFRAYKEFIMENNKRVKDVIGLFFALYTWNDQEDNNDVADLLEKLGF